LPKSSSATCAEHIDEPQFGSGFQFAGLGFGFANQTIENVSQKNKSRMQGGKL
jgi:hypothetical protein